jgi:acetamidase/formamidase family protein
MYGIVTTKSADFGSTVGPTVNPKSTQSPTPPDDTPGPARAARGSDADRPQPRACGPGCLVAPEHRGHLVECRIGPGARLVLPVGVEGALLSLGDAHAAMGDGEVSGTGVETDATVRLRVGLIRDAAPRTPMVETHPRTHRTGAALATTGVGPDLMAAAVEATRALVEEVARRTDWPRPTPTCWPASPPT